VRPLKDTVRLVNQVSYIAKVFLTMNIIFTCPYGAAYALSKGLLVAKRFNIRNLAVDDLNQALKRP